jgi:3-oxoacyl-[acyl-carrier-protein] synthase I
VSDAPPMSHRALAPMGAAGALGRTALQVAMCARARRFVPAPFPALDRRGRAAGVGLTPGLEPAVAGYERLVALGATALAAGRGRLPAAPIPLLLALAEPGRPDDDPRFDAEILAELARRAGVAIDLARSRVLRSGHAAGAAAMEEACRLAGDAVDAGVLVGGIDGYAHPDVLRWLDEEERLHALDVEDGFIPSEGAAFVLVGGARRDTGPAVRAATTASERSASDESLPNLADAMTITTQRVLESASGPIGWVLSDVNGERGRVREWSFWSGRARLNDADHIRLPELVGDVGAASGPMAFAIAATWWEARCELASRGLVALHSDGPLRGAVVMERGA